MKSCHHLEEGVANPALDGGPVEREGGLDISREELERQLEERNRDLAKAVGMLKATLESTKDGILALDLSGKMMSFNTKFAALWGFPEGMLERADNSEMVAYVAQQVKDPEKFIARTQEARFIPDDEAFDVVELKDGRILERRVVPQRIDNRCVGVVVNFREVTKRKRAEQELREAQALYHSLVDRMPSGVFRKNAQGRYDFVNAAYCRITGLPADQILGKTATELVACMKAAMGKECPVMDELGERGVSHHQLIMRTGQEIEAEDIYADPSGKSRYYHAFKSPVFGVSGEVIGSQGILFDITERKRAEGELAHERDLLRMLLYYCPDSIFFKDLESRLVRASRSEVRNLMRVALSHHCAAHPTETGDKLPAHLRSEEQFEEYVTGKSDRDIYGPERAEAFRQAEEKIIRTGQPIVGNMEKTVCPDGKVIWFLTTKAPWRNNEGKIIGTFGTSTDVTELKEAEAKLDAERALLGSLLDNSPDHIYFKDLQSRFIKTSQKHAEQFGFKHADEVLGKTDFDFFDRTHAEPAFEEEQEIIRTGVPLIGKVQKKITKDGHITWALVSKMPLRDKTGKILGTFGISKDISAMKEAEAKLDSERDLIRSLLDNSPDHIYFKDLQSRFIKVSQRQVEIFGLKHPDELLGKTDFDYFDMEHAKPAFEDEQEIIRTGAPLIGKIEKEVFKDGRVSWALTTKLPLRDRTGKIIGTFGISKDVTAMKEADAKLEQLHRQLLETSRQAGMAEVATAVLHNVGNVLNSVNVAANMLAGRLRKSKISSVGRVAALMQEHAPDLGEFMTSDPKGRLLPSYLEQLAEHLASEQAGALEELAGLEKNIDHIKDIVAMQQSYAKVSGMTQKINVLDLVEDALRMNDRALIRHDVKLVREYDTPGPEITVDKHKVMQILINLVRNAKYACDDSGRPEKRLVARVAQTPGTVKISIIDNGVGIPPENLTRIFNHGFTTRKNGHGFGLHSGALSAREMGGALVVQSEGLGKGATFTLELPLQPPASTL
ncbi:MAG: PAS domain S-box protein [Verrucomicrobiota bacterium]|jgi:PAS domain S-box-containing protein